MGGGECFVAGVDPPLEEKSSRRGARERKFERNISWLMFSQWSSPTSNRDDSGRSKASSRSLQKVNWLI